MPTSKRKNTAAAGDVSETETLNVADVMASLESLPDDGVVDAIAPEEGNSKIPVQDLGTEVKPHQGTSVSQVIVNTRQDRAEGIKFNRSQQSALDQNIPQIQGILNYVAKDIMNQVMQRGAGAKIVSSSNSLVMERFLERQFSNVVSDTSYFHVNFTITGEHDSQAKDLFVIDNTRPTLPQDGTTTVIEVVLLAEAFSPITTPLVQAEAILTIGISNTPSPAAIYLMSVGDPS
jgi:hypothetical protein